MPCPTLSDGGWTIDGGGGVATKSAFNLNGGYVEYDLDFTNVDNGVNANIYTISPEKFTLPYFNKTLDYCDGAATGDDWCIEMDWIESNGHCAAATTIHTIEGPGNDGCTAWGCRNEFHYDGKPSFHMRVEYDANGAWTVSRDGTPLGEYSPTPDSRAWDIVKQIHEERGAVIYSSEWTGWVPVDDCGTDAGDLYGSTMTVSNLVVSGSVVQGPEPTECGAPGPAPTPAPAPTPVPSDCPGGSLNACIDMCPSDASAFAVCVGSCERRCSDTPTPTPAPTPTPVPTPPPTPVPTPPPTPVPTPPAVGQCCWGGSSCAATTDCHTDAYCSANEGQCTGNCAGQWCPMTEEHV